MGNTDGVWSQDTPVNDMEIFVGATEFKDSSANATGPNSGGLGLLSLNLAASKAGTFFVDITAMLKRTGVYATPALAGQQFGTAASMPGPSLVAGTSDPEGIRGFPPFTTAQLPTLRGSTPGPPAKGVYVTSVDLIYTVTGLALTLATIGLTDTTFVNNTAPAVVSRIVSGANGMPTAIQAQPYKFNIPVPLLSQSFATASGTETILNVNLTTGVGGTAVFYGAVLHCTYNFN